MILGALFLLCGLGLIATPCLALLGTVTGSVEAPRDGHDLLGTLVAMAVCLAMAVAVIALGVLCLNASLLPKTLEVTKDGIELLWLGKRRGLIPFANVRDVYVQTRAMDGETAEGAYWQAFLAGGLIGGLIARSRFDPDEPVGFVIRLADGRDPDTSWPRSIFKKAPTRRIEVRYFWKLLHRRLVEKIARALARHKDKSAGRRDVQE